MPNNTVPIFAPLVNQRAVVISNNEYPQAKQHSSNSMFRLDKGVTDQAFIAQAEKVQELNLKSQKGYLDRELWKDENGQSLDILHWAGRGRHSQQRCRLCFNPPAKLSLKC